LPFFISIYDILSVDDAAVAEGGMRRTLPPKEETAEPVGVQAVTTELTVHKLNRVKSLFIVIAISVVNCFQLLYYQKSAR
jgi:hypothetical protein